MTVTCNLMGGLGNQLFQIFATISYAIKIKDKFIFLKMDSLGNAETGTTVRPTYWQTFLLPLRIFLVMNYGSDYMKYIQYKETSFSFQEIPIHKKQNLIYLYGYFQSYKYFEEHKDSIIRLLEIEKQRNFLLNRIDMIHLHLDDMKKENTISMHFRLGDYKKLQKFHLLLPCTYYINAIQFIYNKIQTRYENQTEIMNKNKSILIYYFCEENEEDDRIVNAMILKIRNYFLDSSIFIEYRKVSFMHTLQDWEQMLLMSSCKHHIIANSSFSWWGAYFNNSSDKIVCYPSLWFGPDNAHANTNDLFPKDWNKINVK